jgi:uncharacterized protein
MTQPLDSSERQDVSWQTQRKPVVILAVSTVTLITWKYFAAPQYYLEHVADRFNPFGDPQVTGAAWNFFGAFLLMGVLPALIVKFVFHEKLADYGVRLGNWRRTLRSLAVCLPGVILIAYGTAQYPAFWGEYPMNHHAGASPHAFALHALAYFTFYLGWEFQFRGFMQHGLEKSMGVASAILVQVMASVLLHIGKPTTETYGAILGGLLWGVIAYRTRSLLSSLTQHASLGIFLDWFICRR